MDKIIIEKFIREKRLAGVKDSTLANYHYKLNSDIMPPISYNVAEDVIFEHMEGLKEKHKVSTYTSIVILVNDVLEYLYRKGHLLKSIKIPYPKSRKEEAGILDTHEQILLENYLMNQLDSFKFGVLLARYTGIRVGELSALKHGDIDKSGILHINKTLQRIKNLNPEIKSKTVIVISDPKSVSSIRKIPLPDFLLDIYNSLPGKKEDCYLLTNSFSYIEPRTIERRFSAILKNIGIEETNFHTLRHTFATECVRKGIDIKCLSEILGHANVKITLDRYVHSDIMEKRKNMNKLKGIIKQS